MLAPLALVLLLAPQLVDKTEQLLPPPPPAELTAERRGDIYMARKMYREANETYQEALKTVPKERAHILYNKLGISYHQQMQLDLAKKHYERAIKLNRQYSEAVNNLGTVHYAKKSYRRAISQYKKALKLSPYSASVHSNLGTAYFARKKYKDASQAYFAALQLDPEIFEHRGSFGSILQERTVEDRARFHYYLAKTYAAAGHFDRALQYLRRALEEGYRDRDKIKDEGDFAGLHDHPEFQQLLAANLPVIQR
jgi:tetratricopeptide (TPR) repeat protein